MRTSMCGWALLMATPLLLLVTGGGCSDASNGGPGSNGSNDAGGASQDGSAADARTDAPASDAGPDAAADGGSVTDAEAGVPAGFVLSSTSFAEGQTIPRKHTCFDDNGTKFAGLDQSPPLTWSGAPQGTQSFAVVMRDVSLQNQPNYHWVIYDIPANVTALGEDLPKTASLQTPAGAKQTYWSFSNDYSYRGPCPPSEHDYQFTIYALNVAQVTASTDAATVDAAIQAAKIGSAILTGKHAP